MRCESGLATLDGAIERHENVENRNETNSKKRLDIGLISFLAATGSEFVLGQAIESHVNATSPEWAILLSTPMLGAVVSFPYLSRTRLSEFHPALPLLTAYCIQALAYITGTNIY